MWSCTGGEKIFAKGDSFMKERIALTMARAFVPMVVFAESSGVILYGAPNAHLEDVIGEDLTGPAGKFSSRDP
jgi:hypothetical protein